MPLIHTANFWTFDASFGEPVNIASKHPSWWKGESYRVLFPSWSLVKSYKESLDSDVYTEGYCRAILDKLDPSKVYDQLTLGSHRRVVLLCWEKPGDFCHRRLVAEWFEKHLEIKVPEITMEERL
jgi:L-rhamnose isomerase